MEATKTIEQDEKIEKIRSFLEVDIAEEDILRALTVSENDTEAAIKLIRETPGFMKRLVSVKRTSTGARISVQVKQEGYEDEVTKVKEEAMECDSVAPVGGQLFIRLDSALEAEKKGLVEKQAMSLAGCGSSLEDMVVDDSVDGFKAESDLRHVKKEMVEQEPVSFDQCESTSLGKESDLMLNTGIESKWDFDSEEWERVRKEAVESDTVVPCSMPEDDSVVPCSMTEDSDAGIEKMGIVKEAMGCDQSEQKMEDMEAEDPAHMDEGELKVEPDVGVEKKGLVSEKITEDPYLAMKRKKDFNLYNDVKVDSGINREKKGIVKEEPIDVDGYQPKRPKMESGNVLPNDLTCLRNNFFSSYNCDSKPGENVPKSSDVEDGEFPDEPDWVLVGRSTVAGLSTCKGKKLDFNEIVHFVFPSNVARNKIVRFSTKRAGEIGRLPIEWTNCIIPLVNAKKVKVLGRCVAAPLKLGLMQEIHLYVSFYIHRSIFTNGDKSSWNLSTCSNMDTTVHPLPTLFKLLKIIPFQKAEFTPEELDGRKRASTVRETSDKDEPMRLLAKRRKVHPEQKTDEQVVTESTLNKLVGSADVYSLKEMDPPSTLACVLHPYQKQALYWMTESEKGIDVEQAARTLHPCWEAYRLTDKRASAVYVNIFSGEATTKFPNATKMAKGGILADAMGLGKTVMTIALILSKTGKGVPNNEVPKDEDLEEGKQKNKQVKSESAQTVKGGTLIICPMALLGQWKDELDTHSASGSLQVYVQYGVERSADPMALSQNDVVLTTYGVLASAYKSQSEQSIFHKVEWFRVVLDEAHTIKSSKTQVAQAAFALSSHCRWCLTGTPLQNNLEDLYSLLCFLHVEPWCNWAWWQKLIQKPYENGDERAMRLIKSILRPLMLRRTKDTKDKEGRPILVLPPTDIQIIECTQSEAERDFYDALFKRSKVQFDQFVRQGKVLHNYANILELLLRLRQCCNHPFLVMSRADTQKYTDMSKLARQFLDNNSNSRKPNQAVPTRAFVEEVVEGIRRGDNTECPICLESADDPVLTPCAHRMCRECLFSSWRSSSGGSCPICRQHILKTDLITCPSDNQFRVDIEGNWKESSKVSKLLDCLEKLGRKNCGEKSIVFSQWTSFFDLLQIPLKKKGIQFLRFDGKLSQRNRECVLKEFNESKEKTVLLMSLKAGGVGLNLTAASNVFLMDPWWNPAVEEQAIMRIHRIGQKRTVCVRRFIVKDTVEERMQQVQARKERMIAGALTDGEVRTARIEELKMLFR